MAVRQHKGRTKGLQSYHYAWLMAHPHRTSVWLKAMLKEGFHVHHVDGDHSNDEPSNLILVDGTDHMRLHGMVLANGLKRWRSRRSGSGPCRKPEIRSASRHRQPDEAQSRKANAAAAHMHVAMALDGESINGFVGAKWLNDYYSLAA